MKRFTRSAAMFACTATAAALWGCERGSLSGPPELHLGRDECAECGMLVSEERSAAGMLIDADAGRTHLLFDDIGCMLDYEHEHAGEFEVLGRYVHDYDARTWTEAEGAEFVFADSDRLPTPMGSGIAAFAPGAGAKRTQDRVGGRLLAFEALRQARREWMTARYGSPGDGR